VHPVRACARSTSAMLHRREFLLGSIGAGIIAVGGGCASATNVIRDLLKQKVGAREKPTGMIAVVMDDGGTRMAAYGSSGVPGVILDGDTIFEIMSITKVLTSLMLADMVAPAKWPSTIPSHNICRRR
jgi:CubicO group peptidase (beta-lactamase class C family)